MQQIKPSTKDQITVAMDWAQGQGLPSWPLMPGEWAMAYSPTYIWAGRCLRVGPAGLELEEGAQLVYETGEAERQARHDFAMAQAVGPVTRIPWTALICSQLLPEPEKAKPFAPPKGAPSLTYIVEPGERVMVFSPTYIWSGVVVGAGPMCIELDAESVLVYETGDADRQRESNWTMAEGVGQPLRIPNHSIIAVQVLPEPPEGGSEG